MGLSQVRSERLIQLYIEIAIQLPHARLGVDVIKLFSSSLTFRQSKLECLIIKYFRPRLKFSSEAATKARLWPYV